MQITENTPILERPFPANTRKMCFISDFDDFHDWAIIVPEGNFKTWLVFLHGHGSHGDQLFVREDISRLWLPLFQRESISVLSPNLRDNAWMCPAAAEDLHYLIHYLKVEYKASQFLFCSGSMGGTGNLIYAGLYPEDVSAIAALGAVVDLPAYYTWCLRQDNETVQEIAKAIFKAYGSTPEKNPQLFFSHSPINNPNIYTMPLYYSHGSNDIVMPVSQARLFNQKMKKFENFIYAEIPDGSHDSPLKTMNDALLFIKKKLSYKIG